MRVNLKFKQYYVGSKMKVVYFWTGTLMPVIGVCVGFRRGCLLIHQVFGEYSVFVNIHYKNVTYMKILALDVLDKKGIASCLKLKSK